MNVNSTTPTSYVKAAPGATVPPAPGSTVTMSSVPQVGSQKGFDWRMLAGAALLLFLVLGGGVAYYLSTQQQEVRQQAADPCAVFGTSQQACVANSTCEFVSGICQTRLSAPSVTSTQNTCSLMFAVAAPPTPSPTPTPTPTPTPSVTPTPTPTPTPTSTPNPVCGEPCGVNTGLCPNQHSCVNGYCRLDACFQTGVTCDATLCNRTTPPTVVCGQSCTTSNQCPNNHTCSNGTCALSSCLQSGVNCDTSRCNVIPPAGCNQGCSSNADCLDSSHVCVSTSAGLRCRLDSNPASETCSPPILQGPTYQQVIQEQQYVVTQPTVVQQQPVYVTKGGQPILPSELPRTGTFTDTLKYVAVGVGAVVLGALGLLLL